MLLEEVKGKLEKTVRLLELRLMLKVMAALFTLNRIEKHPV